MVKGGLSSKKNITTSIGVLPISNSAMLNKTRYPSPLSLYLKNKDKSCPYIVSQGYIILIFCERFWKLDFEHNSDLQ